MITCRRILSILILISLALPFQALASPAPESFAPLAKRLKPSVVNISTTQTITGGGMFRNGPSPFHRENNPFKDFFGEDFFKRFFGDQHREFKSQSLGSGFIWDAEGFIITNNHVIAKADEIIVRLSDEQEFEAEVVGRDPKTDLAVIRIDPGENKLQTAKLGDSDAIEVGDWAIAIGNPFGNLEGSLTVGVISAKGRSDLVIHRDHEPPDGLRGDRQRAPPFNGDN